MVCCQCGRNGICRNCVCVKNKRQCSDCQPNKVGKCQNKGASTSPATPVNKDSTSQLPQSDQAARLTTNSSSTMTRCNVSGLSMTTSATYSTRITRQTATTDRNTATHSSRDQINNRGSVHGELPNFELVADPAFIWGRFDAKTLTESLDEIYDEVVHWKPNYFKIPYGNAGSAFANELARLFKAFGTASGLQSVALKAAFTLPILLLQKPSRRSKQKEHVACLKKRLKLWMDGDLRDLVFEGRAIQSRLSTGRKSASGHKVLGRSFAELMSHGKTKAALRLLSNEESGRPLHLDDEIDVDASRKKLVREILLEKHPPGAAANSEAIVDSEPQSVHPVIYDAIDGQCIRAASLRTQGAAGPSGLDAHGWRRLCTAFGSSSEELCNSLATTAKRLCTCLVDPKIISSLMACRLIALNKNPGVRPIGIGETVRRIIAKAVLSICREDVLDVAGTMQLCAGQVAGVEAGVHSVRKLFDSSASEAALLVDASNAFNSLNRQVALHNVQRLCPSLANILINTYRNPTPLFMDGDVLLSREGTTQGDPLAMPLYAIATSPLIKRLSTFAPQVWYADDATAVAKLVNLRRWWDEITSIAPSYGYFPNATKTWLVVKKDYYQEAVRVFAGTNIKITTEGRPHLGAPLGCPEYRKRFVTTKVEEWKKETAVLADIAQTQPHAAYAAFTYGFSRKWAFLSRVVPDIQQELQPLEDAIRSSLLPQLSGRLPQNDDERHLVALPARLGGIGTGIPSEQSRTEFEASLKITKPLTDAIVTGCTDYSYNIVADQITAKTKVRRWKREKSEQTASALRETLPSQLQRSMDLAQEKGSSAWLTTLPIKEYGFMLHKGAFRDAVALRYGWTPSRIPLSCACGTKQTIEHALSCPKGGFPSIRHNEIRDITAKLLTEVCSNVCVEPELQPLSGEVLDCRTANREEGARLDIAANGLWGGRHERSFMDVRVFNPHAPTNASVPITSCYRNHERSKKRAYEQRVREVEHASFTPLVMSATGGMATEANHFYKRLASRLADKWDQPYSSTLAWLRCTITFSLLRSAIQCIRGTRSSTGRIYRDASPMDLIISESQISQDSV